MALPSILSGPDALILAALLLLAVRLLTVLPSSFNVDTWLELTAGRLIWHTGVPHHETLTVLARGRPWIDQQWLAQLASYALWRLGGLGLLGVTNVALLVSGLAIAVAGARKLGAPVRAILATALVCGWLTLPATEVRTQAFAVPLFALTMYLLARDSRHPSWRVYTVLPVLVLWANLHGSATLGAGLVALRGVILAVENRHRLFAAPRVAVRALGLIVGAPFCVLITPYGLRAVSYYHATLDNPAFRHTVTEWAPITSSPLVAVPFFCLAGVMIWSFGRAGDRTTLWEKLALLMLAAMAIGVVRNVEFFALGALLLVPVSVGGMASDPVGAPSPTQRRINGAVASLSIAVTAVAVLAVLGRPGAQLEAPYPRTAALAAVESAVHTDPAVTIAADTRYGDWLLWRAPSLAGRLASDARFELYTASEMYRLTDLLSASGPNWEQAANGDRLLVLNRATSRDAIRTFEAEPGARVLYADAETIVILRSTEHGV